MARYIGPTCKLARRAGTDLLLVYVFTAHFGLVGAMYAFALNYLLYLAFNVVVARRYLGRL